MIRWGDPPHVTSPIWGPPLPCKQALKCLKRHYSTVRSMKRTGHMTSFFVPTPGNLYMIQCNHCSKQYMGETKRRLKDHFNGHRRPVDNPSNISKPTTVSEHFLTNDCIVHQYGLIPPRKTSSYYKQCKILQPG